MGFFVFSFRNMTAKKLTIIAFVLFSIGTFWNYTEYKSDVKWVEEVELAKADKANNKELSEDLKKALESWGKMEQKNSAEYIDDFNKDMRKGYFDVWHF